MIALPCLVALGLAVAAAANGVIYIGGPYSSRTNGEYVRTVIKYNDAPVYQRTDQYDKVWSVYKRLTGRWVLDFNAVSEEWDGTVAYTISSNSEEPYGVEWDNETYACTTDRSFHVRGMPFAESSNGEYTFAGVVHSSGAVYQHVDGSGVTWSLYRRLNGVWHVDSNGVSEDNDGSISYTTGAATDPTTAVWMSGTVTRYAEIHVRGAGDSSLTDGAYLLSDAVYNGAPVYKFGAYTLHKRADNRWYLDFGAVDNASGETLAHSVSTGSDPTIVKYSRGAVTAYPHITATGMNYAQDTDGVFDLTATVYNGAPVYARTAGGYTWSIYQRANGIWCVDFNDISEDWDGTIEYSNNAGDDPTAVEWLNGIVVGKPYQGQQIELEYGYGYL